MSPNSDPATVNNGLRSPGNPGRSLGPSCVLDYETCFFVSLRGYQGKLDSGNLFLALKKGSIYYLNFVTFRPKINLGKGRGCEPSQITRIINETENRVKRLKG